MTTKRDLNIDLLHSGKYRKKVVRDHKNDYKKQEKHRNRRYHEGGFFIWRFLC